MKHLSFILFTSLLLITIDGWAKETKVACIGNSITYGAGIANREKNSYPAQLQAYLGKDYEVGNFGSNGATALSKGDYPYIKTDAYKRSLAFSPDIVIIMLGTNDSKPQNIRYEDEFGADFLSLIRTYRQLPAKPRIIVMSPPRCFLPPGTDIKDSIIRQTITPVVQQIVRNESLEYIDLYNVINENEQEVLMPDKLHPSSIGAGRIATSLYQYLRPESLTENKCTHPVPGNEYRMGAAWTEGSDWHAVSEEITQVVVRDKPDILFLGNSITQALSNNRKRITYKTDKPASGNYFGNLSWESAGISGDKTENLLWRVKNGEYGKGNPKYVVLTIGINNVTAGDSPRDIGEGIVAISEECKLQFPGSKIIILGLLPAGKSPDSDMRKSCNAIHDYLGKIHWQGVTYINPTAWFIRTNGELNTELYSSDFLHLNENGYDVWCNALSQYIKTNNDKLNGN